MSKQGGRAQTSAEDPRREGEGGRVLGRRRGGGRLHRLRRGQGLRGKEASRWGLSALGIPFTAEDWINFVLCMLIKNERRESESGARCRSRP